MYMYVCTHERRHLCALNRTLHLHNTESRGMSQRVYVGGERERLVNLKELTGTL